MRKLERFTSALLPLTGVVPQLVKEETISAPTELTVVKSGITLIVIGLFLYAEAVRNRQMEAAHKIDRNMSRVGINLVAAGLGAVFYGLWGVNRI